MKMDLENEGNIYFGAGKVLFPAFVQIKVGGKNGLMLTE